MTMNDELESPLYRLEDVVNLNKPQYATVLGNFAAWH